MAITRAALGRANGLGALYDARTDAFVKDNLLTVKLTEAMIDSCDLGSYEVDFYLSNDFNEKAKNLNIEPELQVSIISGLLKFGGPVKYLLNKNDKDEKVNMSFTYKAATVNEEIPLRLLKEHIDMDCLQQYSQQSTHVVVGIDWGAQCTVNCEYSNKDQLSKRDIEVAVLAKFSLIEQELGIKGNIENKIGSEQSDISQGFTFTVKSDLNPVDSPLPICFEEAVKLAKNLPLALKTTNNGKGIQMTFHMKPLDQVIKMFKLDIHTYGIYKPIQHMLIDKCTQTFKELVAFDVKFEDTKEMFLGSCFASESLLKKITDIDKEFQPIASDFRTRLQNALQQIRSDNKKCHLIDTLQADFSIKLSKLDQRMKELDAKKSEVKKGSELQKIGFNLILESNASDLEFLDNGFVLYIDDLNLCKNDNEIFQIFRNLFEIHRPNYKFLIVIKRLVPEKLSKAEAIHFYKIRKLVSNDVVDMITLEKNICSIELPQPQKLEKLSENKSTVRLLFDNEFYKCEDLKPLWICVTCKSSIDYGTDTKLLYCNCGQSNPNTISFKAKEILSYSRDKAKLLKMLDDLPQTDEINILILGETGVGKSTWINGIFNYFAYPDLEEACKKEIVAVIPSKFEFEGKTISVGNKSDNEAICDKGESCTQGPKLHEIIYKNFKINIIDTPGVGDCRGSQRDKSNFDNILAFLTNFTKLHAVCILMRPNITRINLWFRFCIEELLTHLHSSIQKNIIFCFTNARQTFYKPGDTLLTLREYLRRKKIPIKVIPGENCFCFDNEAFRYLACIKSGVHTMDEHFKLFQESWNLARNQTQKLLDYACHLTPHQIADTISVNSAREAVLQIGTPLAKMANSIIPDNIQKANRVKQDLNNNQQEIEKLESTLKVQGKSFKVIPLPHPRTVCTGEGCWTFESGGTNGQEYRKNYRQICHDNCRIEGLPTEAANDERLSRCSAFQVEYEKRLMAMLGVKNKSDIPGYTTTICSNKKCNYFEGAKHSHAKFNTKEIRNRLTCEQWEDLHREYSVYCQICGHSYKLHMHITFDLTTVSEIFIKPEIQKQILGMKTKEEQFEALSNELDIKVQELQQEREKILKAQAQFGSFLKRNALIPYNDITEELIKMYITEEEAKGDMRDEVKLLQLNEDLEIYRQKKEAIDAVFTSGLCESDILSPEKIIKGVEELTNLKHNGFALKEALNGIASAKMNRYSQLKHSRNEEGATNILVVAASNGRGGFVRHFSPYFSKKSKH